jgi:hypothetical protein
MITENRQRRMYLLRGHSIRKGSTVIMKPGFLLQFLGYSIIGFVSRTLFSKCYCVRSGFHGDNNSHSDIVGYDAV